MPRHLVIGNGQLLINMDQFLQIRDIFYPYVGQQNHVQGHANRIGVWVDGKFSWLHSSEWEINPNYDEDTLVTYSTAYHPHLGLKLIFEEGVHQREMLMIRKITIQNLEEKNKEVRLFFHQDLNIYETEVGDTAYYCPDTKSIIHYKRYRYFLFNGEVDGAGIEQYTTGVKRFQAAEGTWRDAEDGHLHVNPIAQGSVDSTFSLETKIAGKAETTAYYWMTVGRTKEEVSNLHAYVSEIGTRLTLEKIRMYWNRWVNKSIIPESDLSPELLSLYKRSLLIVRTQTNQNGTIIAANDSDILHYNRDHYSYMWPRDGALVAASLSKAGYHGMVSNFYRCCAELLSVEGYLHHKYNPDGSVGSSWHPYIDRTGSSQLPIQEDETALVLWAFWEHYQSTGDIEFAQSLYKYLIRPGARFLLDYMDDSLDLPFPSYDLWEERLGVFSFTAAATYGGLMAAHSFATLFGEDDRAESYFAGAEKIKKGIEKHLYDQDRSCFIRGIYTNSETEEITKDYTIESSVFGLFAFGVLPPDDPRMVKTMELIEERLSVKTSVGGIARYVSDYYFQQSQNVEEVPGNPWIICTLWMAKWKIARAKTIEELAKAKVHLEWAQRHSLSSGILPEQVNPYTGKPLSVAPLTWSHSTYVDVVKDYIEKYKALSNH
ncbi:glycoside hydrolase family 15 protein [Guptibacillus algicola]|uniref:glycoside hydrolase family 15 protein n=1 Tax=Guptibacillus algicola TaxID=225844 RepID=UPI001CD3F6CC|nr:glycoside hydrolase family 15 protein [Alkalihalobacillus algicola]MCA0986042.1 glycoside hydrolase family 15 protein [Alkalihalobacillus algicola]